MKFTTQLHILVFVLGALVFTPAVSLADNVTITNSFSTSANSGGNHAESGQVIEGSSNNTMSVRTVVNGEVVEDYTESSSEPIEYHNTYTSETNNASVEVHVETNASVQNSNKPKETNDANTETSASVEVASETPLTVSEDENTPTSTQATTSSDAHVAVAVDAQPNVFKKITLSVVTILSYVFGWFN